MDTGSKIWIEPSNRYSAILYTILWRYILANSPTIGMQLQLQKEHSIQKLVFQGCSWGGLKCHDFYSLKCGQVWRYSPLEPIIDGVCANFLSDSYI